MWRSAYMHYSVKNVNHNACKHRGKGGHSLLWERSAAVAQSLEVARKGASWAQSRPELTAWLKCLPLPAALRAPPQPAAHSSTSQRHERAPAKLCYCKPSIMNQAAVWGRLLLKERMKTAGEGLPSAACRHVQGEESGGSLPSTTRVRRSPSERTAATG